MDLEKNHQLLEVDGGITLSSNVAEEVCLLKNVIQISSEYLELFFTSLELRDEESFLEDLIVTDKNGERLAIKGVAITSQLKQVRLRGDFQWDKAPYRVSYGNRSLQSSYSWQVKDERYSYEGELGAQLLDQGRKVSLRLWSPSADQVDVILYDKDDQNQVLAELPLVRGEKGTWSGEISASDLGLNHLNGYYYHYRIWRDGQAVLVLDPYAKSLAAWNSDEADKGQAYKVAKAALVDPSLYGPKDLTYAEIPGFKRREDAIIYEVHVRDFTSDKDIAGELHHQFGTFAAFAERLDYVKDLGVTHIQLLPVLSYYFANEWESDKPMAGYASSQTNYNWGYDPQSYFSLTGMYSQEPSDPTRRITEFKNLVAAIHDKGMGVILDVVYNHTAQLAILEDLEPQYYHFMDADSSARTSFGGGRLGTTHAMSRRLLLDSIAYLTKEYKVDGFRFDMMGDHDAKTIEMAYKRARSLNPNLIMLGEGWLTYVGDENSPVQAADQSWMKETDTVAVFSDDMRNRLKSGYPNEGTPAFITGGKEDIHKLFANIKAQPTNFEADSPGDVIQYIAAHDNLTLYDSIAQSIKKDPGQPANQEEILRRQRLGNLMVLTAQGTAFLHAGQEYGRSKQFRDPAFIRPVAEDRVPHKSHLLVDADGKPFDYPYFIHDSYDSSDAINHFDWGKVTDRESHPENCLTKDYTKGLIALRQSTDAFRLKSRTEIDRKVKLLTLPGHDGVEVEDLVLGYQTEASNGERYLVYINADTKSRRFELGSSLKGREVTVLADGQAVNPLGLDQLSGVLLVEDSLELAPLTATILKLT